MFKPMPKRRALSLVLCVSGLALTACSTQGYSSRYGAGQTQQDAACGRYVSSCETNSVPGGYVVEYYRVQQPVFETQTCCYKEPPVVYTPPPVAELPPPPPPPPVVELPPPPPPVVELPPPPPVITPPPPLRPSCPEGAIPGYGGEGCVTITISRK